jgi:uncharacterized protein (DUF1684 family)
MVSYKRAGLMFLVIALSVVIGLLVHPYMLNRDYHNMINKKRMDIDVFMKPSANSPIPIAKRSEFGGLQYYPIDPDFRAAGYLKHFLDAEVIEVPTSADTYDRYLRYGIIQFSLMDQPFELEVWKPLDGYVSNRLFIAFTDLTSGTDTYGGGRYLNIYEDEDNEIAVDFNLAYNPYCVYDVSYICPLAPPENRLNTKILAGEMMYD